MSDKAARLLYQTQQAPRQALPAAVARFSAARVRRPAYALPALAASLLLALWVAMPMQEGAVPEAGPASVDRIAVPGLASLSLPSRPTMPNLAQVNVPSGNLAIPRFNQISITPDQRENTQ